MKIKMKIRIKMRKGFFLSLSLNLFFWSMVYSPYFAAWRGNFSGITVSEGVWEWQNYWYLLMTALTMPPTVSSP